MTNSRNITLDILKIVLALFVILLHSFFLKEHNEKISFIFVNGVFRIAVPIFFIINGYFFHYFVTNNKLRSWLTRVIKLYLIWMFLYSPIWFKMNFKKDIVSILVGYHHLWYLKAIILCGLTLSLFHRNKQKILLIPVFFITGVMIEYIGNYDICGSNYLVCKLSNITAVHRNFLLLGFPFFAIGYIIKNNKWEKKIKMKNLIIMLIVSFFFLILESLINYTQINYQGFDNLFSLILVAPLVFLFFINQPMKSSFVNSKQISLFSTSLYLIHPAVMYLLKDFFILGYTNVAIYTVILSSLFSIIVLRVNKKINLL